MVKVVYNHGMPLQNSAIRHFIVNERTIVFPCHLFGFLFQEVKIAAVTLVIYLIIKRHEVRIPCYRPK